VIVVLQMDFFSLDICDCRSSNDSKNQKNIMFFGGGGPTRA